MPSISFPPAELAKITAVGFYEERMLFLLLLLRSPDLRIVFVTSMPVDPATVDYYLRFVPDGSARERLTMVDAGDPSIGSLSDKVLAQPALVARLRELVPEGSTMLPFNVTPAEAGLAVALGVTVCGAPAHLARLGSKSGARKVAMKAGVPRAEGAESLFSLEAVAAAISAIRLRRPEAEAVVVKLDNGFSGIGNAILEMDGLADPLPASKTIFCAPDESWPSYEAKVRAEGAVVEELLRVPGLTSPSVQLRVGAGGEVEVLSSHDQILGGPEGQVYIGCRFPALPEYRSAIVAEARRVGEVLAGEGVIGSLGIDWLVTPAGDVYLSEINLRMGGTTHPYWMARLAGEASYDPASGELVGAGGNRLCYTATDNIKLAQLEGWKPADVIALTDDAGLAFDPATGVGVTLHLLGAVGGYGKLGATCIAGSPEAAGDLYVALVDQLAGG
ncbi:MAG TPA: peptide ligase PGM1-related protein [Acidimicrobiales bacterium]|nr:peptide ligase PGM1-related protein [Acidimicrobiales bacterium]